MTAKTLTIASRKRFNCTFGISLEPSFYILKHKLISGGSGIRNSAISNFPRICHCEKAGSASETCIALTANNLFSLLAQKRIK